jgi:hypothetical protein
MDPNAPRPVIGGRRDATRVLEIVASRSNGGTTLVRITADGSFAEDGWLHFRSRQDPALYTIALPGVGIKQGDRSSVEINHPSLRKVVVTTGGDTGGRGLVIELHLGSPEVVVSRVTGRGPHLVAELIAPRGTSSPEAAPERRFPEATAPEEPAPAIANQPAGGPDTAPRPTASRILEISTRREPDGSTIIAITANGPIPTLRYRHIRVSDDPPRNVLSIVGVEMPDAPPLIPVGDACLRDIKVVHRQDQSPPHVPSCRVRYSPV